jgi:hypothetical protein
MLVKDKTFRGGGRISVRDIGSLGAMMSMPDALPTEIALIALPSFKFQVYSTSLHHYYHRPITLSTFRLPYQPTIDHMKSINAL